ncbi:unnamed protein product [Diatraea saccharalis]|uniref:Uncharacterized protein n=1 Tax=Diatraea saccharalis TaxID=40085 RepID=A0A9N9R1R6_9NEOP|nr:unnamed protein product [Diatraea saccharalis]
MLRTAHILHHQALEVISLAEGQSSLFKLNNQQDSMFPQIQNKVNGQMMNFNNIVMISIIDELLSKQAYFVEFHSMNLTNEVPFEGVDNYVCVPHSWVIIKRSTDNKVFVAYPNQEDLFDTRDRVKRNENCIEEWKCYMAEIRFETSAQSKPTTDRKLTSSSRSYLSKFTKNKPQLTPKTIKNLQMFPAKMSLKLAARPKAAEQRDEGQRIQDNAGCSKAKQSAIIGELDRTKATVASSSDKPASSQLTSEKRYRSSPVPQAKKQLPSLPIIDVDTATEVIGIDKEDELQEKQQSEANTDSQSQRANNLSATSVAPPQPSTSIQQSPHSAHHDHRKHSQDGKNSHIVPVKTEVQSVIENDTNETPCNVRILYNEPNTSHLLPKSPKMSAQLYDHVNERPSMIPMHELVGKRIRLANSERLMAIAAQNPSNLMDQRRSSPPEKQKPPVNIPDFGINIGKSFNMNALDPKVVLERIDDVASVVQHTPSLPHQRPSFVRRVNKRRYSPPLKQCQQQPMDVPETLQRRRGSHSITQRTDLEELSMREASSVQRLSNPAANQPSKSAPQSYQGTFHQEKNQDLRRVYPNSNFSLQRQPPQYYPDTQRYTYIPDLQRLETRVQGKPIDRNPGSEIPSQYIIPPAAAGEFRSLEGPSYSSQQYRRELLRSGSDNLHQPFLPHQRMPYQLPDMAMKQVLSESNIANSSTVRSPPRSADHIRHTDKCMKVDPVFPDKVLFHILKLLWIMKSFQSKRRLLAMLTMQEFQVNKTLHHQRNSYMLESF